MLYLLVLACVILSVLTFNLAPEHLQIFTDPTGNPDSYFGFSVALLEGTQPRLVVGAPRGYPAAFSSQNTTRPGIIYFCGVDGKTPCEQVLPGKPEDFLELSNTEDVFLGASLDVQHKGSGLVACAPRWSHWFNDTRCSEVGCLLGLCYFMKDAGKDKDVERLNQKIDPNDLVIERSTRRFMIHRQAGMSVHFVQNGPEVLMGAVGVDRGNGGILRFQDTNNEHVTAVLYEYRNQQRVTDNYFGYSVGSGKFRKDKSFYVGSAPRSAAYKGKVFVLDIVGSNHEIVQEIDGRQMGEYFGASLCVVDLNGDGLDDLLVGAPQHYVASYWDTGAVYVLMNNAKDGELQEKFKISGEDQTGARFGMSISAIGDINKDGYVDVAVGAPYESGGQGAVYLYHGSKEGINPRYKQRLTAKMSSFPLRGFGMSISRGLDVDSNSYNDIAVGAYDSASAVLIRSYPVVTVHPRLSASVSKVTPNTTLITVTCCLSYEEAGASNMELEPIEITSIMELDKTYERAKSRYARKRYQFSQVLDRPREQKCKEFPVYLQPPRGKEYDAKPIDISVECKVPVQSRSEFCKNCPVVDPEREIRNQLKIPVDLLCGRKAECSPDLVLHAEFVNIIPPYVIGSTNIIGIKMRLENKMEPAYNTQFNVSVSEVCRFRRIPAICQVLTKGQLMCTMDKPLLQQKFTLDLELDVSNLPTNFSLLQVNITAESLGSEQNPADNYVKLSLPVKHDVDILMRGKSEPSLVIYQDEDSEEERLVSHIYEIHNFGVTPARKIQVEVFVPTAMCINTTFVNVVNLNSSQNVMDGPVFRCVVGAVNMTRSCEGNTRDKAAVLHLDCDMIDVQCTRVICSGGPLLFTKGHLAIVSFRPQLKEVKTLLDKKNIVVHSLAQTRILDFADSLYDRLLEESVSTVFQWKVEQEVDIWVIVGSVLGGLLLLLLICFILYKLGFFKRKKMETHQALLTTDGTPCEG